MVDYLVGKLSPVVAVGLSMGLRIILVGRDLVNWLLLVLQEEMVKLIGLVSVIAEILVR